MDANQAIALQNAAIDIAKGVKSEVSEIPASAYVKPAAPVSKEITSTPTPKSTTPVPTTTVPTTTAPTETWFPINLVLGGSSPVPTPTTTKTMDKTIMYMGIGVLVLIMILIIFGLIKR